MSNAKRTCQPVRVHSRAEIPTSIDGNLEDLPPIVGFDPGGSVVLPPVRHDVPLRRREQAALIVFAIARGLTPEEIAEGVPEEVVEAFEDPLERHEGLAHLDALLEVLCPREVV